MFDCQIFFVESYELDIKFCIKTLKKCGSLPEQMSWDYVATWTNESGAPKITLYALWAQLEDGSEVITI